VGYRPADIKRWAKIISELTKKADDIYVYFKHEELALALSLQKP
jgi:uncharacterized protein YecE (DUF72 family)